MYEKGKPRIFENPVETENMQIVSPFAIKQLKLFLFHKLPTSMCFESAIELGCGKGHVTRELFVDWFKYVDLLDQCQKACEFA